MHGYVGVLSSGRVRRQYGDGCTVECLAPEVVVLEPGHDAWVVGREPAVLIQFDAAGGDGAVLRASVRASALSGAAADVSAEARRVSDGDIRYYMEQIPPER
jgi:hypothetical protein